MAKLIGVTGKTGSGKTTFSDILAQKDKVAVIHVDDILNEYKAKYFKPLLSKDKNGERTKINAKLKTVLYGNKLVFELFMRFRAKLVEKSIDEQIEKLTQEGNQIIIIDDIFIKYMKRYDDMSKVFIVRRPYKERQEAIKQRDGLSKKEIVAVDVAHHKENYKEISGNKNIEYIENRGTQEELSKIVDDVYEQQFLSVDFKEKYKHNVLEGDTKPKEVLKSKTRLNRRNKKGKETR